MGFHDTCCFDNRRQCIFCGKRITREDEITLRNTRPHKRKAAQLSLPASRPPIGVVGVTEDTAPKGPPARTKC